MKRRILTLSILTFFLLSISSFSSSTADLNAQIPPLPGEVSSFDDLPFVQSVHKSIYHIPPSTVTFHENIVDLILQVNETMVLGYLENLTSFGPRVTGSAEIDQAAEYLYDEFSSMGLPVEYHNWSYGSFSGKNVVATLQGDEDAGIYIICAHFDSVTDSPGADDDASGVVAVLCAAFILCQQSFDQTIQFIAFSGEEQGLLGSQAYAEDAFERDDPIIGVLNADMIGYATGATSAGKTKVYYDDASEWIVDFTTDVSETYQDYLNIDIVYAGYSWRSDHYSFWLYGYNAIFYHEYEFNTYYHSPQDIIDNMNLSYLTKNCKLMLATLAELSQRQTTQLAISSVTGGVRPSFEIINTGQADAIDVSWNVIAIGGILERIEYTDQGTYEQLLIDETKTITLQPIIGFGPVEFQITTDAPFAKKAKQTHTGFTLFFYTILRVT